MNVCKPLTAGIYTDYGMFSCDPELGRDVCNLFKYLTGHHYQEAGAYTRPLLNST